MMRHPSVSCAAVLALAAGPAVSQTCNTADRSVALILDASGSMHARLPGGESRNRRRAEGGEGRRGAGRPECPPGPAGVRRQIPREPEELHVAVAVAPASTA